MSQLKVEHNHRDGRGLQKRKHLKDYFTLSLQDKDAHIEGKKRKISARKGHAERLAPSTARTPYWPILCHFWCRLFSPMTLPDNKCMPYSLFHVPDNNFKILGSVWNKKLEMKTEKHRHLSEHMNAWHYLRFFRASAGSPGRHYRLLSQFSTKIAEISAEKICEHLTTECSVRKRCSLA